MLKPIITLVRHNQDGTYVSRSFERIDDEAIQTIRGCILEDYEECLTKEEVEKHFLLDPDKLKTDFKGFENEKGENYDFEHEGETVWEYYDGIESITYRLHESLVDVGNSFDDRLCRLGQEAFDRAKEALRRLGKPFEVQENTTLYVDPCNDSGFLYRLKAKHVHLLGDTIVVTGDMSPEREKEIIEDEKWDDVQPDEVWTEGGEWYAEWEGLFQLLDMVINTKN